MVNVSHVNLWQYSRKSQLWNYMQRNTCIHVQVKVTSHQTTVQFNYIATKWFCITWFPVSIYFRFFFFLFHFVSRLSLGQTEGFDSHAGRRFYFPKFKGGITSAAFLSLFFFLLTLSEQTCETGFQQLKKKKKSFWLTDWIELWYLSVKLLVKIVETPHNWEQKFLKRRMAGLVFHFTRSVLRLKPWVGSVVKVGALYSILCGLFLVNSTLNSLDFFFSMTRGCCQIITSYRPRIQ